MDGRCQRWRLFAWMSLQIVFFAKSSLMIVKLIICSEYKREFVSLKQKEKKNGRAKDWWSFDTLELFVICGRISSFLCWANYIKSTVLLMQCKGSVWSFFTVYSSQFSIKNLFMSTIENQAPLKELVSSQWAAIPLKHLLYD